jgi:O-acetyl-ADP-ribose deacetylase (regulator of RNase III)
MTFSSYLIIYTNPIDLSSRIQVVLDDITTLKVDAVVNAANSSLMGGGGVDGAIHRVGGPAILEECQKIVAFQGGCPTGNAVITTAGNLPAKYVIHTVGPIWSKSSNPSELLADCYQNSLQLAIENNCRTVAFPNISTGIYGYPKQEAARVSVITVSKFLENKPLPELVTFCCFDEENYALVLKEIANLSAS